MAKKMQAYSRICRGLLKVSSYPCPTSNPEPHSLDRVASKVARDDVPGRCV